MPDHVLEESLTVRVERIVFAEQNGFRVISVKTEPDHHREMIIGNLDGVQPGQRLKIYGRWTSDSKYGTQFHVSGFQELQPDTQEGLEKYLAGQFTGIGLKLARRMIDHLGPDIIGILNEFPEKIKDIPGIGDKKYQEIIRQWQEKKAIADTAIFLKSMDIGSETAKKIIRQYGFFAMSAIRENPYRLAEEVSGIGFLTADKIAGRLALAPDSPSRCEAAIRYELHEAEDHGHSCLPRDQLLIQAGKRIDQSPEKLEQHLMTMLESRLLIQQINSNAEPFVFTPSMDRMESELTAHLVRLARSPRTPLNLDIKAVLHYWHETMNRVPDPQQEEILNLIKEFPILILTGGPGTGKTTLVTLILHVIRRYRVLLASPTGRAAQRLQETTGQPATTLHRLLEFNPKTGSFAYHTGRKLPADFIIIDESSMLDLGMATALLRAVEDDCRLIFVGDAHQLPSVGPGQVLSDMIQSGIATVVRLTRIFRQSSESRIITNAHRILSGEMPDAGQHGDQGDFYFIEKDDPDEIIDLICRLPSRLTRHLAINPIDDIQILSPMHRGSLGVTHLNAVLQKVFNPANKPVQFGKHTLRVGDKVMQLRNNYDYDVFNGDIGRISRIIDNESLEIRFGDRELMYPRELMDQITLAYVCSIHKSQGSEYPVVIIPVHTQHFLMLRRQLLYTGVTRGKKMVILVGMKHALELAINDQRLDNRFSMLAHRIATHLQQNPIPRSLTQ